MVTSAVSRQVAACLCEFTDELTAFQPLDLDRPRLDRDPPHRRFNRMLERGKARPKVVVAVAREFTGFIWAALRPEHS